MRASGAKKPSRSRERRPWPRPLDRMRYRRRSPVAAAIVLPVAFGGLLLIGVIAVAAQLRGTPVLVLAGVLVAATSFVAEPLVALPLAVIGWFAEARVDRPPYREPPPDRAVPAAV